MAVSELGDGGAEGDGGGLLRLLRTRMEEQKMQMGALGTTGGCWGLCWCMAA